MRYDRDLCFALIREEARSGEGENRSRRATLVFSNQSVIKAEEMEKKTILNSIRASIGNDLIGESEACLRYRLAIVLMVIEGP